MFLVSSEFQIFFNFITWMLSQNSVLKKGTVKSPHTDYTYFTCINADNKNMIASGQITESERDDF
jgi:hypothetical protein